LVKKIERPKKMVKGKLDAERVGTQGKKVAGKKARRRPISKKKQRRRVTPGKGEKEKGV